MNKKNYYALDKRNLNDLHKEISRLAASFTPEWRYDLENPDIGTVIGIVFAKQVQGNINRLNRVFEKYHTEFVNLLNISLQPAYPASGVIVAEMMMDSATGADMPKGTRLISGMDTSAEAIVFETVTDLHVTSSEIKDIFSVSPQGGKIIVLRGDLKRNEEHCPQQAYGISAPDKFHSPLVDGELNPFRENKVTEEQEKKEQHTAQRDLQNKKPMRMFDFSEQGIQQNILLIYHKTVFNTSGGVDILIRFSDTADDVETCSKLANSKKYSWFYKSKENMQQFTQVAAENGILRLTKTCEMGTVAVKGQKYALVGVQALEPVIELLKVKQIELASESGGILPQFVSVNGQDSDVEKFMPFGEVLSLFNECYICHDEIFAQQGASVRLSFALQTQQKITTTIPVQEETEFKVIKRRPQHIENTLVDTFPQQVVFEYYNGEGWRRLILNEDCTSIFAKASSRQIEIVFTCPEDWQAMALGFDGRSIRMRVAQADNCYLQPCRHNMPLISNLRIAYSFCNNWRKPQIMRQICGTQTQKMEAPAMHGAHLAIFKPLPYAQEACYFGFDKRIEAGPISILFELEKAMHFGTALLRFEYSGAKGFAQLRNVLDYTENLAHSGMLVFMPPPDFTACEIEGKRRWWIRIIDERQQYGTVQKKHITVNNILLNAVAIRNVISLPEKQFYLEATRPNMAFALDVPNILYADVFVNEWGRYSAEEMQHIIKTKPDDVRVEYNFLGDIIEFFVKWEEVDNFDASHNGARHYIIDKMTSMLHFGTGIAAALPMPSEGVVFTVRCVYCSGENANLPAGAVNTLFRNILHIENVYNPVPTSAGSNIESVARAHKRGRNIISNRNRLISEDDFVREALSFSSSINKVKCVIGISSAGVKKGKRLTIVVLMNNYGQDAHTFAGIAKQLKEKMLPKCEITLNKSSFLVCEPTFVAVSVEVWLQMGVKDISYAIRDLILEEINDFLNPIKGNTGKGWEIGDLPTEKQILQKLHSINCEAFIKRFIATACYTDENGVHECEISKFPKNPFTVAVNGKHRVHYVQGKY